MKRNKLKTANPLSPVQIGVAPPKRTPLSKR